MLHNKKCPDCKKATTHYNKTKAFRCDNCKRLSVINQQSERGRSGILDEDFQEILKEQS